MNERNPYLSKLKEGKDVLYLCVCLSVRTARVHVCLNTDSANVTGAKEEASAVSMFRNHMQTD